MLISELAQPAGIGRLQAAVLRLQFARRRRPRPCLRHTSTVDRLALLLDHSDYLFVGNFRFTAMTRQSFLTARTFFR